MNLSELEAMISAGMSVEDIKKAIPAPAALQEPVVEIKATEEFQEKRPVAPVRLDVPPSALPPQDIQPELTQEEKVKRDAEGEAEFRAFKPDPSKITKPDGFAFDDPVELLIFLDDDISSGRVKLHPWQIQIMMDFAKGGITDEFPFQALVRACNGSGKDKYVIAPCAVWLCMRYSLARAIVTSSSGDQLDNQTDAYIYQLCLAANRKIHAGVWKLNYRYYECLETQSPMKLFATDEPGKAEGYHPLGHGKKMAIFMSEAKSIPDDINNAINKCTGYTHRVHVSTPGSESGHFWQYCMRSPLRSTYKDIYDARPIDYLQYHITAFDCSHLSRNYIEQCKRDLPGGENGAAYKSQVLAEFGTTDEMVVIPSFYVWTAINSPPKWIPEPFNTAGVDLSDGGDETTLTIRNGNKHLKTIPFRFSNTEDTIEFLEVKFNEWNLNSPEALIFADCGGMGKPMLDRLVKKGWTNIRYVDNRHKSSQPKVYKNRNAEIWFNTRRLFEKKELIVTRDDILITQLCTRYYKIVDGRVHQMWTKIEQKAKGHPSPDRADSFNLAFWNYKTRLSDDKEDAKPPFQSPAPQPTVHAFDVRVWATQKDSDKFPTPSAGKDFSVLHKAVAHFNRRVMASKTSN